MFILADVGNHVAWRTNDNSQACMCAGITESIKLQVYTYNIPRYNDNPTDAKYQQHSQDKETQITPVLLRRGGLKARRPVHLIVRLGGTVGQFDFRVPFSIFCGMQGKPAVLLVLNLQEER